MSDVRRIQWLIALAIVAGVGVCWADNRFADRHGAEGEKVKAGAEIRKVGEKQLAHADTVYRRDTIRLSREVKKWERIRDTLVITDTVIVRAALNQADSTIKACFAVVQTCEQKDSAHKVIEAGLHRERDAWKAMVPGRTQKIITAAKWLAIGTVVGLAASHR